LDDTATYGGTNAKMSEVQAAVGLAVLEDFDEKLARRRAVAEAYSSALNRYAAGVRTWGSISSAWSTYPVMLQSAAASALVEELRARRVEARSYYPPLHLSPRYCDYPRTSMLITEDISRRMVCLPILGDMTASETERCIDAVSGALRAVV
jgi:dTDP-4-amino-4,6-dideoxygalactose transaminase